jgi:hypothetical protein
MSLPGLPSRPPSIAATAAAGLALVLGAGAGCGAPLLSRDGQLVFQEKGAHGATVITANGVEFLDRAEIPQPIVRRSPDEPWRAPTGFLLPSDGVWRKTATPVAVQGPGLAVVLRSSDLLIPSWGGEILLRLDAIAPVAAFPKAAASVRPAERLVIVVDGAGPDTLALADIALDNLGGGDRAGIVDATGARPVLPLLPGSHHTLLHASVERLLVQTERARSPRDLAGAIELARGWLAAAPPGDGALARHVLLLTDGASGAMGGPESPPKPPEVHRGPESPPKPPEVHRGPESPPKPPEVQRQRLIQEVQDATAAGTQILAVATDHLDADALALFGGHDGARSLDERKDLVDRALPPPGEVVLDDVTLSTSSVPAPARMIEVSGGESALGLYADHLSLGQVYAGEARTEVARVALPPWVPGEPLELTVTATYRDVASGRAETASATIRCRYSADVEEISRARHGDVIAYASALAMVRRLHRAFLGSELDRPGGMRRLAGMQAVSLADLARTQRDPALGVQAEVLSTLLGVIED